MIQYTQEMMEYIGSKDAKLKVFIEKYGFVEMGMEGDIFSSIVFHIIGQMLSNKVAQIIINRFVDLVVEVNPISILNTDDDKIRACGISYSKIKYIKGFSKKVEREEIKLDDLDKYTDDELVAYLTKVNGIGRWTAEMIATFSLHRLNVFSFDDVALRAGILKVHDEFKTLSKTRLNRLKKLYSPYCTVAAIYYYHVNDYE